jgi:hypothetical protein
MSTTMIRRLLWLALLVALPVPYWMFESGRVSTLWLGELTAFVLAMLLSEGGMVTRVVASLFVAQTLLFIGVTWIVARFATRQIVRLSSERGRVLATAAMIVVLLVVSLLPVYRSPLVSGGEAVNVIGLFG